VRSFLDFFCWTRHEVSVLDSLCLFVNAPDEVHLNSQMSCSFSLLKTGALSSRLGFEVKNHC
jgi:hypothetical protein